MKVQVLGAGCAKCSTLAERVEAAAAELGVEIELEKVSDMGMIMSYGIMMLPGLVVDGEVKSSGKLPSVEEIKEALSPAS
ncbi:MAG: thioredoxin family protein [Planctomycetota bacterium]|jgi:small redox-active disulfide protein 2